ncbi:FAD:protein FMN transferase [Undibacterium sp. RuRC25W]|uniref:FAD:protein FMN transferase n=1 Tax=Undibacterium sp. RuRC25W TaxID=3413047 RepID=UPI003BEFD0B5
MRRRAQPWLGTLVDISILDALPEPSLQAAFQAAFAVIREIHEVMSFHSVTSDIACFNRAVPGATLRMNPHTISVLAAAQELNQQTNGIVDIRIGSRLAACHFLPGTNAVAIPPYETGQQAYALLAQGQVKKLRDDWLDVGGIAKGYAVDQAIAALQTVGVQHACVNAGGDLRVLGLHEIAIRDPQQPTHIAHTFELQNQALATSAMYFSRKKVQGVWHSALFDGRTGTSLDSMKSYSVIASCCMLADGLTKLVAVTQDSRHPSLDAYKARAFIV